jgi:hypothetical protein
VPSFGALDCITNCITDLEDFVMKIKSKLVYPSLDKPKGTLRIVLRKSKSSPLDDFDLMMEPYIIGSPQLTLLRLKNLIERENKKRELQKVFVDRKVLTREMKRLSFIYSDGRAVWSHRLKEISLFLNISIETYSIPNYTQAEIAAFREKWVREKALSKGKERDYQAD